MIEFLLKYRKALFILTLLMFVAGCLIGSSISSTDEYRLPRISNNLHAEVDNGTINLLYVCNSKPILKLSASDRISSLRFSNQKAETLQIHTEMSLIPPPKAYPIFETILGSAIFGSANPAPDFLSRKSNIRDKYVWRNAFLAIFPGAIGINLGIYISAWAYWDCSNDNSLSPLTIPKNWKKIFAANLYYVWDGYRKNISVVPPKRSNALSKRKTFVLNKIKNSTLNVSNLDDILTNQSVIDYLELLAEARRERWIPSYPYPYKIRSYITIVLSLLFTLIPVVLFLLPNIAAKLVNKKNS